MTDLATPSIADNRADLASNTFGRPFDEETPFQTAAVIEDSAGRFAPQRWW